MILYFDTSALVKRYVTESHSQEVSIIVEQSTIIGSSIITRVEMASALAKGVRMNWLRNSDALNAWRDFLSDWGSFYRMPLSPNLVENACDLAWEQGLRGYDATHLATALFWQEIVEERVTLATFDRELWQAGQQSGLMVWPNDLVKD